MLFGNDRVIFEFLPVNLLDLLNDRVLSLKCHYRDIQFYDHFDLCIIFVLFHYEPVLMAITDRPNHLTAI